MNDDDVVRRVQERERQAAEARAREQAKLDEPILEKVRARRRATYALLGDIRQHIQALVAANEQELQLLRVNRPSAEAVQTAGWRLGGYDTLYYLLHDGRLARGSGSNLGFAGDDMFVVSPDILERIAGLYERARLPMPQVPEAPPGSNSTHFWQVDREPVPKPPAGVRFYTDADYAPEPPKKGWLRR